jgi:hypothetical protein
MMYALLERQEKSKKLQLFLLCLYPEPPKDLLSYSRRADRILSCLYGL